MKYFRIAALGAASVGLIALQACSGDSSNQNDGGSDAALDTTNADSSNDAAKDTSTSDASDASDASSCPAAWTALPDADISVMPDGGNSVVMHAAGNGTQDYTCEASTPSDGGPTGYNWVFVGPEATLDDCTQTLIGHHFASDAGPSRPEWQTLDNSYVVAKKIAAFDASAAAVPWLLLQATSSGGSGTIASSLYIQRLYTTGGTGPTTTCDVTTVGNTTKVPYTADYYFYGP